MSLSLSVIPGMHGVDRSAWDDLAPGTPLLSWGYLALLEASGSVAPETGWFPNHLLLHRDGLLVAAAPFYVRTASRGEYLPDAPLTQAATQLGVPYHPRLVGTVPLTPAPGWRILVAPGEDEAQATRLILNQALQLASQGGMTGVHLPWPDLGFANLLRKLQAQIPQWAFQTWLHQQYLWTDTGFGDFEGYLAELRHTRRYLIRKDRKAVRAAGLVSRMVSAPEAIARPRLLESMADFYASTQDKFGERASNTHTRAFFTLLPHYLREGWCLGAAFPEHDESQPAGMTFCLEGADQLWVRHWGAGAFQECLHFELTYYLPITYALERGLRHIDPGRGGVYKALRGFTSTLVPSFHLPFHPALSNAFQQVLPGLNTWATGLVDDLNRRLPWRAAGS